MNSTLTKLTFQEDSFELSFPFITLCFVISVSIIAINGFLIAVQHWKRRSLESVHSNQLLFSLWICNAQHGIALILTTITHYVPAFENPQTSYGFAYRIMVDIYATFLVKTNVMLLCGITMDRYISIFHALQYKTIVTKTSTWIYIVVSWVLSFVSSSLQWFWLFRIVRGDVIAEEEFESISPVEFWYSVVAFLIFLAFPLSAQAVAFIEMHFEIRRIVRKTPPHHLEKTAMSARKRKAVYVFGSMYLTFLILVMPYFSLRLVLDVFNYLKMDMDNDVVITKVVLRAMEVVHRLSPIITGVLYAVTSPGLKRPLVKMGEVLVYSLARMYRAMARNLVVSENSDISELL